jgi:hypothetical protein
LARPASWVPLTISDASAPPAITVQHELGGTD